MTKFKGIDIKFYELPTYFQSMKKKEKETFLTNHANEILFFHSTKQIELIHLINELRKKIIYLN